MKTSLKFAGRIWAYYVLTMVLCLLFVAGIEAVWLRIIINLGLLSAIVLLCVNEGGYRGEKACSLAASIEKQLKDGRVIDPQMQAQAWSKQVAIRMVVLCVLPFWLLSAVNLAVAPMYPDVVLEEAEVADGAASGDAALSDTASTPGDVAPSEEEMVPINWVSVASRLVFMPFVFTYDLVSTQVLNLLFFLFALVMPIAAYIGYMMGPRLRARKLKDMLKGKRRKMRNLKVNRQPRKPKAEV